MSGQVVGKAGPLEQLQRELNDTRALLEEARREVAESRRLAQLGQIAAGIGHELRQPLGNMSALLYCLKTAEPGDEKHTRPAGARDYLGELEGQLALADRIICNLLDFARTQQPERRPTDLNGLVGQQCEQMALAAATRLAMELAPGLPPVLADPVHIERAFHNLVANALESMRETGGELRVSTYAADDCVVLEVCDTGPGIPHELREKIFQPLFSTRSRGLGMGLALTRHLVEANGGTIGFCCEAGAGTRFQLRLPVASR